MEFSISGIEFTGNFQNQTFHYGMKQHRKIIGFLLSLTNDCSTTTFSAVHAVQWNMENSTIELSTMVFYNKIFSTLKHLTMHFYTIE